MRNQTVTVEILDAAIRKLSRQASKAFTEAAARPYRDEIENLMRRRRQLVARIAKSVT